MATLMKSPRWFFYGMILPAVLLSAGWGGGIWWLWASAAPNDAVGSKIRLTIPDGTPMQVIGAELEASGVIRSSLALRIWLQWLGLKEGNSKALQAGTYDFTTDRPLSEIVTQMQTGQPLETRFTIPEGWSIAQMANYFEQQGFFAAKDFIAAANNRNIISERKWLPSDTPSLEGFLFPDTYQLAQAEIKPERVIEIMLDQFEQVALPLYQENQQNSGKIALSLKDWVTLSSIVEKESVLDQERAVIAGVFTQRLKRNMRLEADPTVEYGLGIKQTPEKPLTLAQVRTPSPYNTYVNQGLPPGAIASPSLKSLKAVLEPDRTEYLFFVARYDGSHVFSRTLSEHEKAQNEIGDRVKKQSEKPTPKN